VTFLPEVDTAGGALDADGADGASADVLDSGDGESLLVVVDSLDNTADSTTLHGGGDDTLALDAEDVESVTDPVEGGVGEDDAEADEGDDVGDAGVGSISDRSLDRREDSSAGNTHDHDTSATTGVRSKVGSSESEESRVHRGHEEENNDEDTDTSNTVERADGGGAGDGEAGVDNEEEVGLEDRRKTSGNEATDGEGDQSVGQHLRALSIADTTVFMRIVDKQSSACNLGTDIAELSNEAEEQVVLLPDGAGTDDLTVGINSKLKSGVINNRAPPLDSRSLSDLGQLGEEEHDAHSDSQKCDGQVDILNSLKGVCVCAREEVLRSDERTNERGNTVPGLAELQTSRRPRRVTDDNGVRVGRGLKGSKTTGNDQSASKESTERGGCVVGAGKVSSRPEEHGTKRVEAEAHDDSDLVTLALEDLSGDGREDEVTTTEVHDLETGRFELCNSEDILEVLVQDVEKTVRETPEKEERGDEAKREDEPLASEEATLNGGNIHRNSTATHCVGCGSWLLWECCVIVV
jgi:hypothetical protein